MKILVTGATGFVGLPLCRQLTKRGHDVVATARRPTETLPQAMMMGEVGPDTDWRPVLAGIEAVIHLANRAHVMRDDSADPLSLFRQINTAGTLRLAEQAATAGVRRLVFVSSIKVNGEATSPGRPFTAADTPAPQDAYGLSKWEAERGLAALGARTGLEVAVVRPPLIYGPGVKGNLASLLAAVRRGLPLPFGAIDNRRSLIGVTNLCDLLERAVTLPQAAGRTFVVRDGTVSTAQLVRQMAAALGRHGHLLPVPPVLLRALGAATGRREAVGRLVGSLEIDDDATRVALSWQPTVTMAAELEAMAISGTARAL